MQLNGKNKSYTPHFLYYSVKCVPSINILRSGRYWHFSMLTLNIRVWRVIKQLNNATFWALSRDETTWRKPCHTTADASKSSSFSIANSTSSTPRQLQLIYHLNWILPLLGWKQLTAVRTASQIPRLPSAPKKTSKWKIHLQRYARDVRGCRIFKLLWIYFSTRIRWEQSSKISDLTKFSLSLEKRQLTMLSVRRFRALFNGVVEWNSSQSPTNWQSNYKIYSKYRDCSQIKIYFIRTMVTYHWVNRIWNRLWLQARAILF